MKLILILFLFFTGTSVTFVTDINSIMIDSEKYAECIESNILFADNIFVLNAEMQMCCADTPCANELYQCIIGGGDLNDCDDNFQDCLDDLYGPVPGEHP